MEVLRNDVETLKEDVKFLKDEHNKMKDKQNEMYTDIKVTKEVVLRLEESWKTFDNSRKDNYNKLGMQVIFIIISGVIGSIIGFITRGGK